MTGTMSALRRLRGSSTARVVGLTLYYLAIMGGVFLLHVTPDSKATPFIYQAF
jgi:hypothetical protein